MKPFALVDCPMPGAEPQGVKASFQDLRAKAQHHRAEHIESQIPSKLKQGIRAEAQSPPGLKRETLELKPGDLIGVVGFS